MYGILFAIISERAVHYYTRLGCGAVKAALCTLLPPVSSWDFQDLEAANPPHHDGKRMQHLTV